MSYDTQPVMHHVSAFQHRAGLLAELVHPLRNVFVQVCCTLLCPLLGIIIDSPRGFEEKLFFKAGQRPSSVLWKPILLLHEIKVSTARDNKLDVGFSWSRVTGTVLGEASSSTSTGFATNTSRVSPEFSSFTSLLKMDRVKHTGGCHCGAVRFEVWSSPDLHVFQCNCSICTKKQNHHFIVPKNHFTLLQGSDDLTTYTFNTCVAKHTFCKTCGVQSFYTPRSNPDGYGVAPHCLDPGTVRSVTVEKFCGDKWEESMQAHQSIRDMSKPAADTQLRETK